MTDGVSRAPSASLSQKHTGAAFTMCPMPPHSLVELIDAHSAHNFRPSKFRKLVEKYQNGPLSTLFSAAHEHLSKQEKFKDLEDQLSYTEPSVIPGHTYRMRIRTKMRHICRENAPWSDWSPAVSECCLFVTTDIAKDGQSVSTLTHGAKLKTTYPSYLISVNWCLPFSDCRMISIFMCARICLQLWSNHLTSSASW